MNVWQRIWPMRLMSKPALLLLLLLALSLPMGCVSPYQNPTMYQGAGLGALLGGGLGAAINHRNPWKGAAIGALLGGATGGIAGELYGRSNPPQGYYQQGYDPGPSYGSRQPPPNYYNSYYQEDPYYN